MAYFLISYQPDAAEDEDPDHEGAVGGYTGGGFFGDDPGTPFPAGGVGSHIFLETERDLDRRGPIENSGYDLLLRSVPHELGHHC